MSNGDCEHPELKPKDEKCSEQQIKECHGDMNEHSCECGCECDCDCDCYEE